LRENIGGVVLRRGVFPRREIFPWLQRCWQFWCGGWLGHRIGMWRYPEITEGFNQSKSQAYQKGNACNRIRMK
jgi:hypothetical protein